MRNLLMNVVNEYLFVFPEEKERQKQFINYLKHQDDKQIIDWNNFDGHIVAGGFVYAKEDEKFLVLYHNDLKMFLYPGGHVDVHDKDPLATAIREIKEETGLSNLLELKVTENELVPIDIDTQLIQYNERLNLPEHYHFDFRYLFIIDKILDVKIDYKELSSYQWIEFDELRKNPNYGWMTEKINKILIGADKNE